MLADIRQAFEEIALEGLCKTTWNFGAPTDPFTELFTVWDYFPIHHIRRNKKPVIAIGHKPKKQFVTQKLHWSYPASVEYLGLGFKPVIDVAFRRPTASTKCCGCDA